MSRDAVRAGSTSERSSVRARDWLSALLLFALAFTVYRVSPERELLDPKYTLLTSESLLTRASWDLSPFLPGLASAVRAGDPAARKLPWQLRALDERIVYHYPPGTPLLSVPFFVVQRLFGGTTLDARGVYSMPRERRLQATLAALFAAFAVVLGYGVARHELPGGAAALAALVAAFGSGWWSVASRVLWQHTWTAVLLSAALLELLRWEDGGPARRRPELLGALLVAAFWVRPTNAFSAAAFALYVAWRHRDALLRLVVTGAAGLALYVALSIAAFGSWFPSYIENVVPHGKLRPARALVGQLLSAEHGLLVFSPILLLVAWSLARRGIARERRAIAALALGLVAFYVAYHCWRSRWWGAGTVGPRFLCDVTPYLLWLGAHAWRREREASGPAGARWPLRAAAALLVLASLAAHALGAFQIWPGDTGGRRRGEKNERVVTVGSAEYWGRLPQVELANWLKEPERAPRPRRGSRGGASDEAPDEVPDEVRDEVRDEARGEPADDRTDR